MGLMGGSVCDMLIANVFEKPKDFVSFAFQGGEPTLCGADYFLHFFAEVEKRRGSTQVHYSIQTNGTLIDDEWAKLMADNKVLVGLSLDGTKEINDANRVDAADKSTFNAVMNAARLFNKYKVDFNILAVVTNVNARSAVKVYNYFSRCGFNYLQFIPCLDDFGSDKQTLSVEKYEHFLKSVFDAWYNDFTSGKYISVRNIDNYISMLQGRPAENCAMGGVCGNFFVVEADGSLYPCDFYCVDKWKLGNIRDKEPFEMDRKHDAFIGQSRLLNNKCRQCKYQFICRGGCKRDREPDYTANKYCGAYYAFFEYALPRMQHIARNLN